MKTGYHAIYDKDYLEAIDYASKNYFDFVQFDLGVPKFFLDHLSETALRDIRDYAIEKKVEITFHAPGDNVSLFCDYPLIRKGILDEFQLIFYKASLLQTRHITIHTGQYPEFKKVNQKEDDYSSEYCSHYQAVLYENLKTLLNDTHGVLLCVENTRFDSLKMDTLKRLLSEDHPLNLSLDIPKLYSNNLVLNQEVFKFMIENKSNIREIHIHDYSRTFGRHQNIGDGEINFELFRDLILQEDIYLNFEIRPREAALLSREKLLALFHLTPAKP